MSGQSNVTRNLITINKKITLDFRLSEAFKTLRTNIDFCGDDVKVIAFTSCVPAEGKSSVSFNLAISMIEAGKRVLFIDADLRKPVAHRTFDLKNNLGLSTLLGGIDSFREVLNSPIFAMEDIPPQKIESPMEIQQKMLTRFEYFCACS